MAVNITLSSPTLSLIDETMVDLVSKLSALPARRPRAPRMRPTPFEIAQDPIDQLAMYSRRHPKINIKTSSCESH